MYQVNLDECPTVDLKTLLAYCEFEGYTWVYCVTTNTIHSYIEECGWASYPYKPAYASFKVHVIIEDYRILDSNKSIVIPIMDYHKNS